jgi:glycogen phosphorylase
MASNAEASDIRDLHCQVNHSVHVAYFSMEMALAPSIPTYAGGLGILAGDTMRSAADMGVPLCGITLLHRHGYFRQELDAEGGQGEYPEHWPVEDFLTECTQRVTIRLEGRVVTIRAWEYRVLGTSGDEISVFLLDTDLPENSEQDRHLTDALYAGDERQRFCQEMVLGVGGVRMLRAMGHRDIARFHMNEGHAALLVLELLNEEARRAGREAMNADDVKAVRERCIFTTHTPVPAGHDKFPLNLVQSVLGAQGENFLSMRELFSPEHLGRVLEETQLRFDDESLFDGVTRLNMTYLALNLSHFVNGVAKKHAEVSKLMFAGYQIDAITNGVHAPTWVCPAFAAVFDQFLPAWRQDSFTFRNGMGIPDDAIWNAHMEAKQALFDRIQQDSAVIMNPNVITLGFARRATGYKRASLLLQNPEHLRSLSERFGGIQIIYGGKAHPHDGGGKQIIKEIIAAKDQLGEAVKLVYLQNYNMELAQLVTSGVDVWLNTPLPPMEASGTSGMKAAFNGVPSLSVRDGWWLEGCIEGITGWAIDADQEAANDASELYGVLEDTVLPLYHNNRQGFIEVMRHAIALNGSFFNTQRMLQQYVAKAYFE